MTVNLEHCSPGQKLGLRGGGIGRYLEFKTEFNSWPHIIIIRPSNDPVVLSCTYQGYVYSAATLDPYDVVDILPLDPTLDAEWVLRYRMHRMWGAPPP